ncbi:MAG TPA: hypothetical protein VKO84_10735 [Gaiellaceae bacterium]|nr:hypothetical protein [Gaiellaceae bacterium]
MPDDDSRQKPEDLQGVTKGWWPGRRTHSMMTQTKLTIAALTLVFAIAALIVLSAVTMGAVAGN